MDQINVQEANLAEVVDTGTNELLAASSAERKIRLLNDWEMVLAGGGDSIPCW